MGESSWAATGSAVGTASVSEGSDGGGGGGRGRGEAGGVVSGHGRGGEARAKAVPNVFPLQVCMCESISRSSRSASPSSASRLPKAALANLPPTAGMVWSRVISTINLYAPG